MTTQILPKGSATEPLASLPKIFPDLKSAWQCLLIVWGAPKQLQNLQAVLMRVGAEITYCLSAAAVERVCDKQFDFVIVDVEPKYLAAILQTIRSNPVCAETPVWVERSHLYEDSQLAGILPQYRAMPCSSFELTRLIHLRLLSSVCQLSEHRPGHDDF